MRRCAAEMGFDICSRCGDLEVCTKFDWLGDSAGYLREKL